jgi:aspartate/methionine/tyrosine aminotransferase
VLADGEIIFFVTAERISNSTDQIAGLKDSVCLFSASSNPTGSIYREETISTS